MLCSHYVLYKFVWISPSLFASDLDSLGVFFERTTQMQMHDEDQEDWECGHDM